jgi:hypothetical protein
MPGHRQCQGGNGKYSERDIGGGELACISIAEFRVGKVDEGPKRYPNKQDCSDKTRAARYMQHIDIPEQANAGWLLRQ